MNKLTLELSHMYASIVKFPLVDDQIASNMKELTQERNPILANIVKML